MIEVNNKTEIQVIIISNKINKKHSDYRNQLKNMNDFTKNKVIIRLHRLKKIKEVGKLHVLDIIRECYANHQHVYVSEVAQEVKDQLGNDGIYYYTNFSDAYDAACQ